MKAKPELTHIVYFFSVLQKFIVDKPLSEVC